MFAQHGGRGDRGGRGNDTDQSTVPGHNEILTEEIRCYSCQKNGHYSDQCPNQTGTNLEQMGLIPTQRCADIEHTWILLEACSKNSVSNNTDLTK